MSLDCAGPENIDTTRTNPFCGGRVGGGGGGVGGGGREFCKTQKIERNV